jgi:hypothetical protein
MKQKVKQLLFLFTLFALYSEGIAGGIQSSQHFKKEPAPQNIVKFTENKNQWDKKVLYRAQLDGGVLFLEKNCFTYNFYDKETLRKNHIGKQKAKDGALQSSVNAKALTPQLPNSSYSFPCFPHDLVGC